MTIPVGNYTLDEAERELTMLCQQVCKGGGDNIQTRESLANWAFLNGLDLIKIIRENQEAEEIK